MVKGGSLVAALESSFVESPRPKSKQGVTLLASGLRVIRQEMTMAVWTSMTVQ